MSTGAVVAAIVLVASGREEAAQVLLEADAGLFGYSRGVGIEGLEKILDLLLDLDFPNARGNDHTWLDVALHFRLHSCPSRRNLA
jgi:hypothetical protein